MDGRGRGEVVDGDCLAGVPARVLAEDRNKKKEGDRLSRSRWFG